MNTTYLCTLGISIANRLPDKSMVRERLERNLPWEAEDSEFEKALRQYAAAIPASGPERDSCCAEATILAKMKAAPGDRVRLLATDTCLGRLCGEAVKGVLIRCFGLDPGDVSVLRIEDLQVGDAKRLREYGIKNLLEVVQKHAVADRNTGREVCLCPNGGYKGAVPFLTLAGMILHCKVVYTFEFAGAVVVLPPLPFALDAKAYLRARDAIAALYDKVELPEAQFLGMVTDFQPGERDRFLGFTEPSGTPGFVTLSPLVEIATAGADVHSAWLSPQAAKDLAKLGGGASADACRRLALRSQDPLYRSRHIDWKHSTDLESVSIPHTPERVMGYGNGGRFLVCRIFADHNEYERFLGRQPAKKDYPPETFTDTPLPLSGDTLPDADAGETGFESWEDLKLHCERLEREGQNLRDDIAVLGEDLERARADEQKARHRCEQIAKRRDQLWEEREAARRELADARAACNDARARAGAEASRAAALEQARDSLAAELAEVHARLEHEAKLGFFSRLRRVFRP